MFVTVTDLYSTEDEQRRMSIIIRARTKDDACQKAASFVNPAYELAGYERWFDMDAGPRKMLQVVFRLPKPIKGYKDELRVAAWKKP
ncbi:hypothetical protein [Butyrivibrio sp.]|uniref:hypothetical protein n=1 Tax=Butyrivibrio sp. TaxID=28121 RepID=UPI0025BDACD6|nr:hypothetical protein [Butyrivibrio sp.]MBQ7428381.1 hypothetical protein [Butyrivibrio sp.]MBQ9303312.1 hypothetical protein [Butyrivibrio sp.]